MAAAHRGAVAASKNAYYGEGMDAGIMVEKNDWFRKH